MLKKSFIIQIIIAVASLASIGIFIHLSEIGPITTTFYRCILAIPLLIVINRFENKPVIPLSISKKKLEFLMILSGIGLGVDICAFSLSFKYTTMAETNLIVNLTPFLIFPVTLLYFKERTSPWVIMPIVLALAGLYQLVFAGSGTHQIHVLGDFISIVAAVFYALFVVITKILANNGVHMGKYMIRVSLYCAVLLLFAGLVAHETWFPQTSWGWVDLLLLAIISQVLGQLLLAKAMSKVPLQVSSSLLLLQPVFAAIYGLVLFHESLSAMQIIGGGIVLLAVLMFKRIEQSVAHKASSC